MDVIDETKKTTKFVAALRRRTLTWFMNFRENNNRTNDGIRSRNPYFITFGLIMQNLD
jgi:hypothetical protein